MNWILICSSIAYNIYIIYNAFVLDLFGIPHSLSMSYYHFKEKKNWLKIWFPVMMVSMASLLLPAWLDLSENSDFQFLAFTAAAGIIFTGSAPAFLDSDLENKVHSISAIIAAISSILWIILVTKLWYSILIFFIVIIIIAAITKTIKTSYVYWLETIAFMSTFVSIILHCL